MADDFHPIQYASCGRLVINIPVLFGCQCLGICLIYFLSRIIQYPWRTYLSTWLSACPWRRCA
ncbi:hypothetical protein B0H17DRAFT_1074279 [Mycena rosella]|uniref:Uncharacterized protein n=1 Tax=Mycena rosella TaxID=1033263 RepID=A0AAD7GED0_MYCRO|nr:hypothetical protein B0H17DRAFT_1074279 [Mycena rosella]